MGQLACAGSNADRSRALDSHRSFKFTQEQFTTLGGLGSIRGTILGALLIGMTRAFGQVYAAELSILLTYAALILTLIVRPEGLFSTRRRKA